MNNRRSVMQREALPDGVSIPNRLGKARKRTMRMGLRR